ncbi:MAG TPA: hypothetical protein VJN69_07340 [Candidatus Acidoferrales bacterium]|nr:hypothetical protein [Candidatus Acidoferrales bacterium]
MEPACIAVSPDVSHSPILMEAFVTSIAPLLALVLAVPMPTLPTRDTGRAFDRYVAVAEARIREQERSAGSFLDPIFDSRARFDADLRQGGVAIAQVGATTTAIPGGLIHDWTGAVLIPDTTVAQALQIVQDYNHLTRYYTPEVMDSRLISRDGDNFHIFLRMREHKVITVVLDAEYDVTYGRLDASHQFSLSRSTRITEIADAGEPHEHPLADVDNHGYLWRMNSYWRFVQIPDGVVVECEAISLTRSIPEGLGWLIEPYLRDVPRDSLRSMLVETRDAVESVAHGK